MRALLALLLLAAPALAADTTPFYRMGDPFLMQAGPTAQQYQIAQPPGSTSYRFVNPCNVDIRIKTVATASQVVTASTGTRFLARTAETVASTVAPTTPRIVSIMTLGDPGSAGCAGELQYGTGQ
ncbi:hypothetical protein Q8W71_17860 [Methylobacterium sp. NEAU 140]|uniref:hypothetical protein n=1 Tax=Methylobacterium sp. NEAU 140 TaxID=3064945 RepID=UPI0027357A91|nr:hypothetical protein [Methylobacterium sp. NEAU 140]MDP4024493.1 hypothetical protein [Methylobacterium sp. NEAU 140]